MSGAPAAREVADRRGRVRPSLLGLLLSIVELPIALLFASAVMIAIAWLGCSVVANRCVDLSGIPWYVGGLAAGLALGGFYWWRAFRLGDALRRRLLLDAIVLALGAAPYLIAWTSDHLREREYAAKKAQTMPRITK